MDDNKVVIYSNRIKGDTISLSKDTAIKLYGSVEAAIGQKVILYHRMYNKTKIVLIDSISENQTTYVTHEICFALMSDVDGDLVEISPLIDKEQEGLEKQLQYNALKKKHQNPSDRRKYLIKQIMMQLSS